MKTNPFLAAQGLCQVINSPYRKVSQPNLHILDQINLQREPGEIVAIVEASSSGKTTLLSMLAGLDTPYHDRVFLAHTDITALNKEKRANIRKQHVAFIFQNFQLLPSLNAKENVMLPLEVKYCSNAPQLADDYLNHVGARGHHYPAVNNNGVAIANAFAAQAPILFADETTGNLDTDTGAYIKELLFQLNRDSALP